VKLTYRQLQPVVIELNTLTRGTGYGFGLDRTSEGAQVLRVSRDSVLTPPVPLFAGSCRECSAFLTGVRAGLEISPPK
jgi:hypothetical protein